MTIELDRAIKSVVADIIAAAPDVTDDPSVIAFTPAEAPRRWLPAAAAVLVVAAGVVAIALVSRDSQPSTRPASAEQPGPVLATNLPSQPTAPATSQPADPATTVGREATCVDGESEAAVPDVVGVAYSVAAETLREAGFGVQLAREVPPQGQPAVDDAGYVVVAQLPPAGRTVRCGDTVTVNATSWPVYTVQYGDTWESIAEAQGVPVEELLGFNDFTIDELELAGGSVTTPLEVGRVVRLSRHNGSLDTAPPTT